MARGECLGGWLVVVVVVCGAGGGGGAAGGGGGGDGGGGGVLVHAAEERGVLRGKQCPYTSGACMAGRGEVGLEAPELRIPASCSCIHCMFEPANLYANRIEVHGGQAGWNAHGSHAPQFCWQRLARSKMQCIQPTEAGMRSSGLSLLAHGVAAARRQHRLRCSRLARMGSRARRQARTHTGTHARTHE